MESSTYYGIFCSESNPDIYFNDQYGAGGYNHIRLNGSYGVNAANNSLPVLGYAYTPMQDNSGYNTIESNTDYEVYNNTSNIIYAQYNWWGEPHGDPSVYGDVVWVPYLSSPPGEGNLAMSEFNESSPLPHELNDAYVEQFNANNDIAASMFKDYFINHPDSPYTIRAVVEYLKNLDYFKKTEESYNDIEETKKSVKNSDVLFELNSGQYTLLIRLGEFNDALDLIDNNIKEDLSSKQINRLNLHKAIIHIHNLNDVKTGEYYLDKVIDNSAKNEAVNEIATLEKEILNKTSGASLARKALSKKKNNVPNSFKLSNNYPNPFNPSTTVQYSLPHVSDIQIIIYNTLGQPVTEYRVNGQEPGSHLYKWQGKNNSGQIVSSGLYILRFVARGQNNAKIITFSKDMKLLLVR
ncbi:MAG: T9SS type A sorting domain-containing protein [Caldithrix sp.]|nr:T9SS type A sorting domain-containing protein [Caldithrix sp.]